MGVNLSPKDPAQALTTAGLTQRHALIQMTAEPAAKECLLAKKKLDDLEFRRKLSQETT